MRPVAVEVPAVRNFGGEHLTRITRFKVAPGMLMACGI